MIKTLRKSITSFEKNYEVSEDASNKLKLDLQESNSIIEDKNKQIAELKAESISFSYTKECYLKQQADFVKQNKMLEK